MLEYEKKLHLDVCYEKLKKGNWSNKLMNTFWCVFCYVLIYFLIRKYASGLVDITAWSHTSRLAEFYGIKFTYADAAYFCAGFLLMCYGALRLADITRQNHSVRDKNSEIPDQLLTTGYYSTVRHPMYGTFVIMYSSLFLSLHSLWGIVIVVVIWMMQVANSVFEERKKLLPVFGDEYCAYKSKARKMLFTSAELFTLIALLVTILFGLAW